MAKGSGAVNKAGSQVKTSPIPVRGGRVIIPAAKGAPAGVGPGNFVSIGARRRQIAALKPQWDAKLDTVAREWRMKSRSGVNFSFDGRNFNVTTAKEGRYNTNAYFRVYPEGYSALTSERRDIVMPVQTFSARNGRDAQDQMIGWLKDNGWTMAPKLFRRG